MRCCEMFLFLGELNYPFKRALVTSGGGRDPYTQTNTVSSYISQCGVVEKQETLHVGQDPLVSPSHTTQEHMCLMSHTTQVIV